MITDKVSDLITRIRNAQSAGHKTVGVMNRRISRSILDVLQKEGYIDSYEVVDNFQLKIKLRYVDGEGVIKVIERVSKPGCKKYVSLRKFKPFFNGLGMNILSTSKGVLPDYEARKENVGGEILFRVF